MHAFIDRHGPAREPPPEATSRRPKLLDGVRTAGAELLGTTAAAVAVVGSASEGLGQVASMLGPDRGTVVLVATDFPSVTYPWLAAAERGEIELRFVDYRVDRDLRRLIEAIDPATSVVTFGAVQYATGSQIDVGRVASRAHDAGAHVVVDATQVAGAGPVDMSRWAADAVVTSGYKWLSSHGGVALLALAPHLRDRLPRFVGWKGTNDPFAFDARTLRLADDARRFELSTMSYASVVGLESSIALLSSVGFDRIEHHAANLAARLVGQVEELGWRPFRRPGDPGASPHIVSLRHARNRADITAARLASDQRIVCGGRGDGLRISSARVQRRSRRRPPRRVPAGEVATPSSRRGTFLHGQPVWLASGTIGVPRVVLRG